MGGQPGRVFSVRVYRDGVDRRGDGPDLWAAGAHCAPLHGFCGSEDGTAQIDFAGLGTGPIANSGEKWYPISAALSSSWQQEGGGSYGHIHQRFGVGRSGCDYILHLQVA